MKRYVVDASVAVKWYLPEAHRAQALSLFRPDIQLDAPAFIEPEFANALAKKVRRGELQPELALAHVDHLRSLPMPIHPIERLLDGSLALAIETGCSVYDALYVVLAKRRRAKVVTGDLRLCKRLAQTPYADQLVWIGDFTVV